MAFTWFQKAHLPALLLVLYCAISMPVRIQATGEPAPGSANVCTRQHTAWVQQPVEVRNRCCKYVDCGDSCYTNSRCRWRSHRGKCERIEQGWCISYRMQCVLVTTIVRYCCSGFELNERNMCERPINCPTDNGGCQHYCNSTGPQHTCGCFPGYRLVNRTRCVDIDECQLGPFGASGRGECDYQCNNLNGTFYCECQPGYELLSQTQCGQINECEMDNGGCDQICIDTDGDSYCECNEGFTRIRGFECEDTNECLTDNGGCSHYCNNTMGSYQCYCDEGRTLDTDNRTCVFNECAVNNGGCSHNCTDQTDGYQCSCDTDYQLGKDQHTCQLILPLAATQNNSDSMSVGVPVGAALAGLVFLVCIILLLLLLLFRRRRGRYPWQPEEGGDNTPAHFPPVPPVVVGAKIKKFEEEEEDLPPPYKEMDPKEKGAMPYKGLGNPYPQDYTIPKKAPLPTPTESVAYGDADDVSELYANTAGGVPNPTYEKTYQDDTEAVYGNVDQHTGAPIGNKGSLDQEDETRRYRGRGARKQNVYVK